MIKQLTAIALAAIATLPAHAAVSLTASDLDYSQTFDTLATSGTANAWANDSTLAGWSLFTRADGSAAAPNYRADNGGSNTGAFFSYGSTGTAERALGAVGSSGAYWGSSVANEAVAGYIALSLQNDTGKAIDSFKLTYDGEQWRNAGNATPHAMTVQYGFGDSFSAVALWSDLSDLTFTSPIATASTAALNGNLDANRTAGLTQSVQSLNWSSGSTLWVRWAEINNTGSDHALAIDDVTFSATVSAVPEPQTYALMLGGLGLVGWMARRRKA